MKFEYKGSVLEMYFSTKWIAFIFVCSISINNDLQMTITFAKGLEGIHYCFLFLKVQNLFLNIANIT